MTPPVLRAPANRVSSRARSYWTIRAGLGWVVVLGVVVIVWASGGASGSAGFSLIAVALVLAALHLGVMPRWRYRVHRWEATDTAVYTQSGWFRQERRIAPIARVQTIDTHRGPIEQLFGLSNVTVTTASAAGPLRIHGLDRPVADRLVDELTRLAQAAGGDGT